MSAGWQQNLPEPDEALEDVEAFLVEGAVRFHAQQERPGALQLRAIELQLQALHLAADILFRPARKLGRDLLFRAAQQERSQPG